MSRLRLFFVPLLAICGAMLGPAGAQAGIVTVGSPLNAAFVPTFCEPAATCTGLMASLPESGAVATSRVEGMVVRWRILQGTVGRGYKLRVLTPNGGTAYSATGTSAAAGPKGEGIETFPTALPIKAGQTIGIDLPVLAKIGFDEENGGGLLSWSPALPEGPMPPPEQVNGEIAFNADVQPRPTVTGLSPAKGSFKGELRSRSPAPTSRGSAPSPSAPLRPRASRSTPKAR